jgi:hypothetical protein
MPETPTHERMGPWAQRINTPRRFSLDVKEGREVEAKKAARAKERSAPSVKRI